jgi:hypothetical protein
MNPFPVDRMPLLDELEVVALENGYRAFDAMAGCRSLVVAACVLRSNVHAALTTYASALALASVAPRRSLCQ